MIQKGAIRANGPRNSLLLAGVVVSVNTVVFYSLGGALAIVIVLEQANYTMVFDTVPKVSLQSCSVGLPITLPWIIQYIFVLSASVYLLKIKNLTEHMLRRDEVEFWVMTSILILHIK